MGEVTFTEFPFKTIPYKHQLDCWRLSRDREAYALLMEMGCGKSKVICDTAAYLFLKNKIQGQVIIAPKGVYLNWVENELPIHMSDAVPHKVAYWSSYARKSERDAIKALYQEGNFLRTLVVNIEAINSEKTVREVVGFMQKFQTITTVDESTTIKNPSAKRTKIMINIGKYATYRRICSGNPIPNGPLDLYSQTEFLKTNQLGFTNYFAFRNRFAVMQDKKFGNQSFKHVVGYRDLEKLKQLMRSFSFVIKKNDCLDLPPKIYQTIDVEMGPKQAAAYQAMRDDAFIQLSKGQVTAKMVITQLLRLHQISCGFLKPDEQLEVPFGEPNDRLDTLMNLLSQAPGKVIIWATYRYNIKAILAGIKEKFGPETVVEYYGDTDDEDRRRGKKAFQDPDSPVRFMVSNPDTGKFGNTWTQATTVIYFSNSYNLESREQSEDRAHRIGQQGAIHAGQDQVPSVLYIDLCVRNTVDERIIKVLKGKKKLTDEIVESNWRWFVG